MAGHAAAVYACNGPYSGVQMMPKVVIMTLVACE